MSIRIIITLLMLALIAPVMTNAQANDQFRVGQQIGFDTTAPTIPDNVTLEPVAATQIDVSWDASYDLIGVTGYELWRDGSSFATITAPTTSYSDTGLTPLTIYEYTVRAFDLAGNYSGFSTSTSTSTLDVPPVATTTPSVDGGSSQGTFIGFSSFQVSADAGVDSINLTLSALSPFRAIVRYGTTYDGEGGTLSLETYRRLHTTSITGLLPGTSYTITVTAFDGRGHRVERTIVVRTTSGIDTDAPTNPDAFRAESLQSGVSLTWKNPTDEDFDVVRIMRMEGTVPVDPYDGVLIYEGAREGFMDSAVAAGRQYGYAIFARDRGGNYSSGAIAFARAYGPDSIGDAEIVAPEIGTSTDTIAQFVRIEQNGTTQVMRDGRFTIANNAPFILSVPAEIFPRVLKTIMVTLSHPDDPTQTFSFLLRTNDTKDQYLAKIGALTKAGEYRATISVLDLKSQTVMTDHFSIESVEGTGLAPVATEVSALSQIAARIIMLAIALLLILYAARRMWHRGRSDAEAYNNDGYKTS